MLEDIKSAFDEAAVALDQLRSNQETQQAIASAATILIKALKNKNRVFSCGNGGSMCDAMHFAEELSGKFRQVRAGLPAVAISDPAHLTCVANDFGFEDVFSRFIEAHGVDGDILLAISTSGSSPNILKAAKVARQRGMKVIALTGQADNPLQSEADIHICASGGQNSYSDRVQELHIKIIHTLIELCERALFPTNYK